jgi:hypothetical protein
MATTLQQNEVSALYATVLDRASAAVSSSEVNYWTSILSSGTQTLAQVTSAFVTSTEAQYVVDPILRLYEAALDRTPDQAGLQWFVQNADTYLASTGLVPGTSAWIAAATSYVANTAAGCFVTSPEFLAKNGLTSSTIPTASQTAFVQGLYTGVLDRSATTAEVTYWVNVLNSQGTAAVINGFAQSTEYTNDEASAIATWATALGTTATGASTATTVGTVSPTASAYGTSGSTGSGTLTGVQQSTGPTITLTTGKDAVVITISNTTVAGTGNGSAATFTSGDTINGGAYFGNTLTVTDLAATAGASWTPTKLASVTVAGVQTVNFISAEAVTVDMTKSTQGYTGLTLLTVVSGSDAAAVDSITVGATTAVTVTDATALKAVTADLTVTGGSTVSISEANGAFDNHAKAITVAGGTATTTVSVTQTEGAAGYDQTVSITDANEAAGSKGVITAITLDGLDNASAATIADNALANLTVNDVVSATVSITEGTCSSPATTLNLTLNADTALTLDDVGAKYTTLAVTTGASGATVADFVGFTGVTAETVGGSGVLTQSAYVTGAGNSLTGLKSITVTGAAGLTDATLYQTATLTGLASVTSTSSGVITVTLDDTKTSFTGGTGQDIVTITTAATKAIAGGAATNNEIVLNAAAATWPTLANITNFTTLGVGAASSGTFNLAVLSGFTAIDAQAGTGTVAFTNVTAGSSLAIDGSATAISYATGDSNGATTDSLAVTIGGSAANASPYTVGTLTATDLAGTGLGTLIITGYDTTAGAGHTISTLVDNSLSSLTIAGTASETIGALTDMAATLTITNTSSSTAASALTMTDSGLAWLTVAGSGATTVTLTDANAHPFTLSDTASAAVTFTPTSLANITGLTLNNTGTALLTETGVTANSLTTLTFGGSGAQTATVAVTNAAATLAVADTDSAAVTLALTSTLTGLSVVDSGGTFTMAAGATATGAATLALTNSGTGTLTVAGLTDAAAATVTLAGKVSLTLVDALAGAVSIQGAADNAAVMLNLNHGAAGATSIALGNGNDTIIISDSGPSTNATAITVGSGTNSITLLAGHTGGDETIVFSAANGGSTAALTTVINAVAGDTITWHNAAANATITPEVAVATVAAGLSLAAASANGYFQFVTGSSTYIYENAGTGSAADNELVAIVGVHTLASATTATGTLA